MTWTWQHTQMEWPPEPPVPYVPREQISTLYSFGHYDGPATGLIQWNGAFWYVERFEPRDDRFWIVQLTPAQQAAFYEYGKAWAAEFHSGMSWNPDGSRAPEHHGPGVIRDRNITSLRPGAHAAFRAKYPDVPRPDDDAPVVGYFVGWRT